MTFPVGSGSNKSKGTAIGWLCGIGLFGTAGLLSNPDFYVLALGSLFLTAIAYDLIAIPRNRRLLLLSYISIAIYSFVVGRLFYSNHRLDDTGVLLMLLSFPVLVGVMVRIGVSEAKWHAA